MSQDPDYPVAIAKLQTLTKDELHELFTNESKFDDFIKNLDQTKALYDEKEVLMASNKSLAEYNLSQEPLLIEKRQEVLVKQQKAMELLSELRRMKNTIESKLGKVKPDVLYSLLQVAQSEAEKESDQVVDDLLSGKISAVDEFLDTFLEKRKIYHLRRVKLDKMKEVIEGKSSQLTPVRSAPRPPGTPAPYNIGGAVAPPANNWGQAGHMRPPANLPYPLHPQGFPTTPSYP